MRHKILHCAVEKLAETLDSDDVVGWRVLAILPSGYIISQPAPYQQQQILPPGWEQNLVPMFLPGPVPTITAINLTTVTIILEG